MEGTITQLGLKNYLINPNIKKTSFFTHSYQNFTNFAKDTRALTFLSTVNFGKEVSFRFDQNGRYGDLITNIVLELELPSLVGYTVTKSGGGTAQVGYTNSIGNAIIKEITLKIGGNVIDTHTPEYMDIWSSFSVPAGKQSAYARQIKKYPTQDPLNFQSGGIIYIPLFFWFCQNTNANVKTNNALALPLAGMRNAEIELIVKLKTLEEVVIYQTGANQTLSQAYSPSTFNIVDHKLLVDYVILEAEERLKYLNAKRQLYLITQTQTQTFDYSAGTTGLNINLRELKYPVTELIWVFRSNTNSAGRDYFNYSNSSFGDPNSLSYLQSGKLIFDGRDRTPELSGSYFTDVEPFKCHNNIPAGGQIHTFSFALEPENLAQPTGTCNFSGLHEPRFQFKMRAGTPAGQLIVFAINYNVLQVDNKGNVWLLHNLSKHTPNQLPDSNSITNLNICNLTETAEAKAKNIIAKINKFNIYRDPREIESGLANRILTYKRENDIKDPEMYNKYLDTMAVELDKLSQKLANIAVGKSGAEHTYMDLNDIFACMENRGGNN